MKRVLVVSLACFVMLVMASGAFAQEEKPCAGDIAKFCGDAKRGQGRITKCLEEHETQLSSECKTYLAEVKKLVNTTYHFCEDDLMTFCRWVQSGEGRLLNCLKENKSQLSDECKENMYKVRGVE